MAHGLKFAAYEADLHRNLSRLRKRLKQSKSWQHDLDFIGDATCIPKSIELSEEIDQSLKVHCENSEPIEQWRRNCGDGNLATAEFRPVIDASVDFMVASALWVLEIGHRYDACLDTRHAVGNRLRRWRNQNILLPGKAGRLNRQSPSLFAPYFSAYGKWRANGLKKMRKELEDDNSVVAVTMDLRRFYHNIDPSFILNEDYLETIGINLNQKEIACTQGLLSAIQTWNSASASRYECENRGLPVGLTASSLIANVLLFEFDTKIIANLSPSYYGRYVDDVFLVLRHEPFDSGESFISWLADRLGPIAQANINSEQSESETSLKISLPYAQNSDLIFAGKKQKVFQLQGEHGLDLLNPIEEQIRQNTSEFRDLPHLPETEGAMAHRALLVTPDAQLEADALRKADAVTLRRSGFAMLLGDLEAHASDLAPESWSERRTQFYGLAQRHLIEPKAFFDYTRYLPRILGLMAACKDWEQALSFVDDLVTLRLCITETSQSKFGSLPSHLQDSFANLGKRCTEAVLGASLLPNGRTKRLLQRIKRVTKAPIQIPRTLPPIRELSQNLIRLDWAREPYFSFWFQNTENEANFPLPYRRHVREILELRSFSLFQKSASLCRPHWPALAFPTRPVPVNEITTRAPQLLTSGADFSTVVRGLRGIWMPTHTDLIVSEETDETPPHIFSPADLGSTRKIAITNFDVSNAEFSAATVGNPILSLERYQRINSLLDSVVKAKPDRPDYVLLPELAIPRRWLMRIVGRLVSRGVSVIGGVEYLHDPSDSSVVHNQAVVALTSNYPGYRRSLVILQSKEQPAWEEAQLLEDEGLTMASAQHGPFDRPVYCHDNFFFGVLICSDLTNLHNRSRFRGKVDSLMIPEWNRDVTSFASLVESSALDIHAFIAQANNRHYGDSRLRGPMRDSFKRDLVRLKGGSNDYFVVEEIPVQDLRQFHSQENPLEPENSKFKPFPIGFPESLSDVRRATFPD